jgi:hypothetical protein
MDFKHELLQEWQQRAADARDQLASLDNNRVSSQYELEITRRALANAKDAAVREILQEQVAVLEYSFDFIDYDEQEQRAELAVCEAMIAALEADLNA